LPAPEYRSFPSFWNSGKRLSPETILQSFPSLASLENEYGAITYYLANQSELDQYLRAQEQKRKTSEMRLIRCRRVLTSVWNVARLTPLDDRVKSNSRPTTIWIAPSLRGVVRRRPAVDFRSQPIDALDD